MSSINADFCHLWRQTALRSCQKEQKPHWTINQLAELTVARWSRMPTSTDVDILTDQAARLAQLPDLLEWENRPSTQMIPEKSAIASPYLGGSDQKPRDIRTLRRWRESRRGPSYLNLWPILLHDRRLAGLLPKKHPGRSRLNATDRESILSPSAEPLSTGPPLGATRAPSAVRLRAPPPSSRQTAALRRLTGNHNGLRASRDQPALEPPMPRSGAVIDTVLAQQDR